jgi:hypothetical protein
MSKDRFGFKRKEPARPAKCVTMTMFHQSHHRLG